RYERNVLSNPSFFEPFSQQQIPEERDIQAKPVFRLGLNYKAAEYTFLRASWGQGYRFPTIAEKFIQTQITGGVDVVPNADLTSETGWTTEIGIKQGFRIQGFSGFIDASAFWSEYQDMMEFGIVFRPPLSIAFQSRNVGDTRIRGLECSIGGRGAIGQISTNVLAGYTYIDPRFKAFDLSGKDLSLNELANATIGQLNANGTSASFNILKYRFQHSLKLDIESTLKDWSLGLAVLYNSNMDAVDAIIQDDERFIPGAAAFRAEHQGFTVVNLRTAYQITPKIKCSLLLNNALNEVYSFRVGALDAPRNFSGRLDVSF
ncbi:MAG: TonB-dependent receptor, partial [Bacteroidota bacterium]